MDTPIQPHHHHFRLILGLSAGIVILAGAGLWVYFSKKPQVAAPSTNKKVAETVAVPQEFQDFVGSVAEITGTDIKVTFGLTNPNGGTTVRTYTIHTNSKTELKTQTTGVNGKTVFSPLKISDVKIGNNVHAYANTNLYPLSEFTALKIYLIH